MERQLRRLARWPFSLKAFTLLPLIAIAGADWQSGKIDCAATPSPIGANANGYLFNSSRFEQTRDNGHAIMH
jgi:hypothetical protein